MLLSKSTGQTNCSRHKTRFFLSSAITIFGLCLPSGLDSAF